MAALARPSKACGTGEFVYGRLRRAVKSLRGGNGVAWIRKEDLGKGGFGFVSVAMSRVPIVCLEDDDDDDNGPNPTLTTFAVKSAEESRSASLRWETRILSELKSCPHVVRSYGGEITYSTVDNRMYYNILLEYCDGGNLRQCIKMWGNPGLSNDRVRLFTRDILLGLAHIHGRGYAHCDMKPANVLIHQGRAKIGDLGLAKRRVPVSVSVCYPKRDENGNVLLNLRGTRPYLAPEALKYGARDWCVDIWGLGCIVWEMISGRPLWDSTIYTDSEILQGIAEGPELPHCLSLVSGNGKDFLERCLARSVEKRWSAQMLIRHPFLFD